VLEDPGFSAGATSVDEHGPDSDVTRAQPAEYRNTGHKELP
jgi:hypothetical protein